MKPIDQTIADAIDATFMQRGFNATRHTEAVKNALAHEGYAIVPANMTAEQREKAIQAASRAMAEHGYDFPLPVDGDLDDEERGRYDALCAAIDAAVSNGD